MVVKQSFLFPRVDAHILGHFQEVNDMAAGRQVHRRLGMTHCSQSVCAMDMESKY